MDASATLGPLDWLRHFWRTISPPALLVLSFLFLIGLGTAGLLAVPAFHEGKRLDALDALFTMTSAVCVTGLIVVDTATKFTRLGQAWILLFIQLGGLGLITMTTLIIGALGRRLSLRTEMIGAPGVDITVRRSVPALAWTVTRTTLAIEAAGAFVLWLLWIPRYGLAGAAWHAVFHAVSAFCNAGFSTFSDSLVGFNSSPVTLIVISVLIVIGGIGYLSGEEFLRWWRAGGIRGGRRLSTHTFAVLAVTAILLVSGWFLFALFEWNTALGEVGAGHKVVNAWFMSVTSRTAGFNTVPYTIITNASAYLTILLMVVGGSPGSTAGGIKTTALAVLGGLAVARIRGRRFVELHGRSIPEGTVDRTVSLSLMAFAIITVCIFFLSFSEARGDTVAQARQAFLPVFFEAASAFGTVGLSMDVTPGLTRAGKLMVILLMFIGRVGLLSFFAAISIRAHATLRDVRPAREDVIVG